jgi:hypothetical protein
MVIEEGERKEGREDKLGSMHCILLITDNN